jgi:hypothetical protein
MREFAAGWSARRYPRAVALLAQLRRPRLGGRHYCLVDTDGKQHDLRSSANALLTSSSTQSLAIAPFERISRSLSRTRSVDGDRRAAGVDRWCGREGREQGAAPIRRQVEALIAPSTR